MSLHQQDTVSTTGSHQAAREVERACRTVVDFDTPQQLLRALQSSTELGSHGTPVESACAWVSSGGGTNLEEELKGALQENPEKLEMKNLDQALDWVLENYDTATTRLQSVEDELRRLLVLKSFLALDIERQEAFDRITARAQEYFHCPINLIGLMDLGRQWMVSNSGLGDATETPRKRTFCAHTIQSNLDCLVIPDATKDPRFCNSGSVTGPPEVRFYAGVPLISKEGYALGTLCIVDRIARPHGLSVDEKETLKGLAAEAMKALEVHRQTKTAWFKNLKQTCFPTLCEDDIVLENKDQWIRDKSNDDDKADADHESKINLPKLLEDMGGVAWDALLGILQKQISDIGSPGMEVYLKKCAALTETPTKKSRTKHPSRGGAKKAVRFNPVTQHRIESWKEMKELWWSPMDLFNFRGRAAFEVDDYKKHESHFTLCVEAMANEEDVSEVVDCLMHLTKPPYSNIRGLESHIVDDLSMHRRAVVKAVLYEQRKLAKADTDSKAQRFRQVSQTISEVSMRFSERIAKCDEYVALNIYTAVFGGTDAPGELADTSSSSGDEQNQHAWEQTAMDRS
jgi:hypothetical protein